MERFVLTDAQWAKMGPRCLGKPQCCSLCDLDGSGEVDAGSWLWGARSQRVVAHLALDPARHLPASAALYALLQNFVQHRLMQEALGPRGKGPRTAAACAGPRVRHVGTTAGPDPRRPAAPPRASARAQRSAPAADPRTPVGPTPGSCCAARPAPHASASSARPERPRSPNARDRAAPRLRRAPAPGPGSWSPADRAAPPPAGPPARTPPPPPRGPV